jgi:acyl-CoA reductase-like NAD-dependent aldehyde dehydrogenase
MSAPAARIRGRAVPRTVGVPLASQADAARALVAAREAMTGWVARGASPRGRILYRLADVMESRIETLRTSLVQGGESGSRAAEQASAAVDRARYCAGFCDKLEGLLGSQDPVAGPLSCSSAVEPLGVVAIVAPKRPSLLGLVSTVLPVVAAGNACVVLAGDEDPRTALVWCECLAMSDFPSGVINVLTGRASDVGPHLAVGAAACAVCSEAEAKAMRSEAWQGLGWIERFVRTKTFWHPAGV